MREEEMERLGEHNEIVVEGKGPRFIFQSCSLECNYNSMFRKVRKVCKWPVLL
jgi:hypothetical protein